MTAALTLLREPLLSFSLSLASYVFYPKKSETDAFFLVGRRLSGRQSTTDEAINKR